jgi:thiopeptide-type bacteriocin biosynthesis protein
VNINDLKVVTVNFDNDKINNNLPREKKKLVKLNNLYEPLSFHMYRKPLLKINDFISFQNNNFVENYKIYFIENKVIQEAIYLASPSLYNSLRSIEEEVFSKKESKKLNKVMQSFYNYLVRMSTRPTPFGIFSTVFLSEDNTDMKNISNNEKFVKKTRLNIKWIMALINVIEKEMNFQNDIKFKINSLVRRDSSELYLPYHSHYASLRRYQMKNNGKRLGLTRIIDNIYTRSTHFVTINQLIDDLKNIHNLETEEILTAVHLMVENEFLISELRPPKSSSSELAHIIEVISWNPKLVRYKEALMEIQSKIEIYDSVPLGRGVEKLKELISSLNSLVKIETKMPIQVDLGIENCNIVLDANIKKEVAETADILWYLTNSFSNTIQDRLSSAYLRKYGRYREIPFLDVIDESKGIDISRLYNNGEGTPEHSIEFTHFINNLIYRTRSKKEYTLNLTDKEIESNFYECNESLAPDSLELYVEVLTDEKEGHLLVLGPNQGSKEAGKTFGRFLHFSETILDKLEKLHKDLTIFNPNTQFVELSTLYPNGVLNNLSSKCSYRDTEMVIGTSQNSNKESIDIKDLVVGIEGERTYIKSIKSNKEIVFRTSDMINVHTTPKIHRLLIDLSNNGTKPWNKLSFNLTDSTNIFFPRIQYKNTVLLPATWLFETSLFSIYEMKDLETFTKIMVEIRKDWKIPQYVYIGYKDRRLLYDLNNETDISRLRDILLKEKSVIMSELIGDINTRNNNTFSEFIIPLKKRQTVNAREFKDLEKIIVSENSNRVISLGANWLYFKLYVNSLDQKKLIKKLSKTFLEDLGVKNWFFIRYRDPAEHIRIRIRLDTFDADILLRIIDLLNKFLEQGEIKSYCYDTYIRELERYGGEDLIEFAEDVFIHDSRFVTTFSSEYILNTPIYIFAAMNIIEILRHFIPVFEDQKRLLDTYSFTKTYAELYRNSKFRMDNTLYDSYNKEIIEEWKFSMSNYASLLKEKIKSDNIFFPIIKSIVHMHCNRLMGTNRHLEHQAISLAKYKIISDSYLLRSNETNKE